MPQSELDLKNGKQIEWRRSTAMVCHQILLALKRIRLVVPEYCRHRGALMLLKLDVLIELHEEQGQEHEEQQQEHEEQEQH